MSLFKGIACFSPEVSHTIQDTWITHGGMVTKSPSQEASVKYIFCNGQSDAWVPSLMKKAIPVFHAKWVLDAALANFCISISPYLLNGSKPRADSLTAEAPALKTPVRQIKRRPTEPPAMLPIKRPHQPQDEPESAERPHKKARRIESQTTPKDLSISITSRVKFVKDEPVVPASVVERKKIPHIDLAQVQRKMRRAALQIEPARKSASIDISGSASHQQSLEFKEDSTGVPRISLAVALQTLQHIPTDKCAPLAPGGFYAGRRFRCDLAT